MKFTAFALLCVTQAAAFTAPQVPSARGSALFSSPDPTRTSGPPGTSEDRVNRLERQLEQRLSSLEGRGDRRRGSPVRSGAFAGGAGLKDLQQLWDQSTPTTVQGGSLRTWSFANPAVESVQVLLKTEGRPLDADIQLWQGPDNTPHKMKVYVEDGGIRTFNAVIGTPRGPNTIAIRNIGQLEFPLAAALVPDSEDIASGYVSDMAETIQGGALRTYPFDPSVDSVAVLIKTDGRPLNARIELLQGPNNNKQVIELYTEDGMDRPFFAIIDTPGSGNVVRVVNTAPVEFPMTATVEPFTTGSYDPYANDGVQLDSQW